ncbi:MAG: nitroreductase [Desulfobacteraceae bacterium]|nr:nitroreductase [Desulfobacteraceae bacterium]MBC2756342.1 nitroreductase [Desulfobacteraceae bacterium]
MDLNRRCFLKYAASGMIAAGALPAIGCSGLRRKDLTGLLEQENYVHGLTKTELDILYMASLAPSGHNAQPWTVKIVSPEKWIIGSDKTCWLPAADSDNFNCLLSIGAFIENLVIAAGSNGYKADVQITAKDPFDTEIAIIHFSRQRRNGELVKRIKNRRMTKIPYRKKEILAKDIEYLTHHSPEHICYFPKGSPQSTYIEEGTLECNRIQDARQDVLEETAKWIRWSDEDAKKYRDGLTPEAMSIHGVTGWVARHFFTRESLFNKMNREMYLDMVEELLENHGGWIVFTGKDSSVSSMIDSGRRFERLWLKARAKNIAIQPFSQLLEEAPGATVGIKGIEDDVHFIMRVGYIDSYPDPVSLRKPVSWFVEA